MEDDGTRQMGCPRKICVKVMSLGISLQDAEAGNKWKRNIKNIKRAIS